MDTIKKKWTSVGGEMEKLEALRTVGVNVRLYSSMENSMAVPQEN
jgi:hypothetical protein